jgi:uncharacterized protein YjlB
MTTASSAPELLRLADGGASVPNNPRLPVLLWRGALPATAGPDAAEALFARNGWPPAWRNGIYPYHHFHPDAHEALAIARGAVRVQLGGPRGPVLDLAAGDVAALPAGVGHRNLGGTPDLLVVGAYPPGTRPTEAREARTPADHDRARQAVARTPDPPCEPVTGGSWPRGPDSACA